MEGRQWRLAVVYFGSLLAGTLLFWYWHHRRRWSLTQQALSSSQLRKSQRPTTPPQRRYSLTRHRIDVVDTLHVCERILKSKTSQSLCVMGVDCEWVGEERGGQYQVALLQLAFLDGHCLLVRLCKTVTLPSTLHTILQDSKILKFGVGIDNDAKRLQLGFGVQLAGYVDMRHIAVRCGVRSRRLGVSGLAASLLNVEMDKSWRLRCSDWESEELSQEQIQYAAADAAVTLDILKALLHIKMNGKEQRNKQSQNTEVHVLHSQSTSVGLLSHSPSISETNDCKEESESLLSSEAYSELLSLCQGVVDIVYKQPRNQQTNKQKSQSVQPKRQMHAHCSRQTPLYHNCQLLAPDGTLLSVVDHKKIQWYRDRHLGTLISDSPPTLKLKFEPAGKPSKERDYYLAEKENICVVCGSDTNCIRKHIVPQEYRKWGFLGFFLLLSILLLVCYLYFRNGELKDHISHDVLLLCMPCHQLATMYSDQLKTQLAEEFKAPLTTARNARFKQDPALVRVKNFARALLNEHHIPESRQKELQAGVAEYCLCVPEELTESIIQDVAQLDTRLRNSEFCHHAAVVVGRLREEAGMAGLLEFQKRWRKHFLDCMQPRFLPELWSVDHNPHPALEEHSIPRC